MPDELESEFAAAFDATPELPDDLGDMEIPQNASVLMGDDPEDLEGQLSDTPGVDSADGSDETAGNPSEDNPADPSESLESQVFDWTTEKDKLVTVKVAGEDVQISLGEALNGYMRQADYTKKTQILSEEKKYADWARDMQHAFQTDPAGTIRYLQQAFNLDASGVAIDPLADVDPELRPLHEKQQRLEQQLRQQEEVLQATAQERVLNEVRAEIQSVKDEFSDFDAKKVLPLAADRGLPIRDAYLLVKGQELLMAQKAEANAKAAAAEKARVEAAKRTANGQIATGGSGSRATAGSRPSKDFNSFDELLSYELDRAGA